jgi:hypothetical protein
LVLGLAACSNGRGSLDDGGGGTGQQQPPAKVTIGGTVGGLSGSGLVLQNNGGDDLAVATNGTFSFKTSVDAGSPYNITVLAQPSAPSQACSITNAAGTATSNVTSVTVNCSTGSFSVGGTVSGLSGSGLVLRNNGGDDLPIASNGSFTFATELASGSAFAVTVATQPTHPAQTCTVADASGTIGGGDVRTVKVSCATNKYTIRGTVSGLQGSGLVLQNNGGDDVGVQTDGGFAFATQIPSGSAYSVTVKTHPSGPPQSCSVQNGSGSVADRDIDNVVITCALRQFTIGGTISNLQGSGMIIANNDGDRFNPTADGPFTFPTAVLSGSSYNVTVTECAGSAAAAVRRNERLRRRYGREHHEYRDPLSQLLPARRAAARYPGWTARAWSCRATAPSSRSPRTASSCCRHRCPTARRTTLLSRGSRRIRCALSRAGAARWRILTPQA